MAKKKKKRPTIAPTETQATQAPVNEGQRRLIALDKTLEEIATIAKASKQSASCWRQGLKAPAETSRRLLFDAWGIPPDAWNQSIAVVDLDEPEDEGEPKTEIEAIERMIAFIRRRRKTARGVEAVRLVAEERRANAERWKLKREQDALETERAFSEERVVREHPAWLRWRKAILDELATDPATARKMIAAIERASEKVNA